ncbi:MAG: C40 family peptidase [Lachnospiraceae bacterium]|nr:C40 family peptidase [Lachnospiraceae bacterium]
MKQRNRKLACLCITTAILATANTTTAVARESEDQVMKQETSLHAGVTAAAIQAAEKEKDAIQVIIEADEKDIYTADILTEEKKAVPELAVAQVTSYINVRNQPNTEGEIVGKLHNNSVGEIIGEEGEWLKIKSGTVEGYIKAEYALRGEEGQNKANEVGERFAKVEATTLRVREEATTDSNTVGLLPKEEVLSVQEEVEGWVKVDSAEGTGYLSAEHVEVYTVHAVAESKAEEEARLAAEAAARAAEEAARAEAAARAAEEERKRQLQASNHSSGRGSATTASAGGNAAHTSGGGSVSENTAGNPSAGSASAGNAATESNSSLGQRIANYALQFVGNPYVYGGTSLTNGADCSGFVMSVYKHFGISLPRTSGEQGRCGTNVGGIGNARPGDLVHYSGHIGIYIGNGQIVHASSAKTGIKVSNANYRSIISVRRIV